MAALSWAWLPCIRMINSRTQNLASDDGGAAHMVGVTRERGSVHADGLESGESLETTIEVICVGEIMHENSFNP